ncbi:hypothetical protein KY331_03855 [Candidatus Woesearchaeota archaeon]|nr:hypothetical protein [Candidatus Woesearchaeota archaeon]
MELSILIAKIAAVTYLATGIAMLNGNFNLKKVYQEMEKSPMFMTLMGVFVLVLGMLIVQYHNIWVKDWSVLVTIIGWLLLIEGVFYIVFPKQLLALFKRLPQSQIGWGIFTLIFGLIFGYFGFVA